MLRSIIAILLLAATLPGAFARKKSADPVVMTVAGKDVTLSEFEYLYHKNAAQQVEPQTLQEYVDMFVNFKLKVAAAEAAGIDTTAAFLKEFEGYRNEIAAPYLVDNALADSLRTAALSHFATNVDVSHIMLPHGTPAATIDSLYNAILAGADFGEIAARHSIDQNTAQRGGNLGYITAARYPYAFEDVAYQTPVGAVAPPFQTQFGTHILRVNDVKADPGEVHVRHILKLTRGLSAPDAAAKRAEIDSISALLAAGANFEEVAKAETEDPSGRANGGDLPWFGPGMMVAEFENAAFALAPGELSPVVESSFGYHIIYCEDRRDGMPQEDREARVAQIMQMDGRDRLPAERFLQSFRASHPELAGAGDDEVRNAAIAELPAQYPDFRNLLNEYRDGMLLYEVSTREVWGRPTADPSGLDAYFNAHRDRYAFDVPRYKGWVVTATSDSLCHAARQWLDANTLEPNEYATALHKEFGADVRIRRVLAAKGENKVIDHIVWDGEAPEASDRWVAYLPFNGKVIDAPEDAADVGGAVATDYQAELETAWITALREQFPVTINQKVLKKVKEN